MQFSASKRFEFNLSISPEKFLDYYRGAAKQVAVRCLNGVTIQFPASLLTPFVSHSGIHGRVVLSGGAGPRDAAQRRRAG